MHTCTHAVLFAPWKVALADSVATKASVTFQKEQMAFIKSYGDMTIIHTCTHAHRHAHTDTPMHT